MVQKVHAIWRLGYDMDRIQGIYEDREHAESVLDVLMAEDHDQEYTWLITSYDLKAKPPTET